MTIQQYLKEKGFYNEFGSSQLDLIIDVLKEMRVSTIRECSNLLEEYNVDDQGVLLDEIKLGHIIL